MPQLVRQPAHILHLHRAVDELDEEEETGTDLDLVSWQTRHEYDCGYEQPLVAAAVAAPRCLKEEVSFVK